MITLEDVFKGLEYGELASSSIAEDGIAEKDYPKILYQLQLALTAICREFPLIEKEVVLLLREGETEYYLKPEFALSNTDSSIPEVDRYIMDSATLPFIPDVLRVNAGYQEDGSEVPINDENLSSSIFTPTYNTVQVPWAQDDKLLSLVYRANHPVIPRDTTDLSYELLLPDVLLEAVLAYVASKIFYSLASSDSQSMGAALYSKYVAILTSVEFRNILHNSFNTSNVRLDAAGWV